MISILGWYFTHIDLLHGNLKGTPPKPPQEINKALVKALLRDDGG